MIRLDKFLADSGVGTRTDVKKRIREGRITVMMRWQRNRILRLIRNRIRFCLIIVR